MHPTQFEHPEMRRRSQDQGLQSHTGGRRLRSEDSWIEISSQNSSSSLCSEIITTGLQVRREDEQRSRQLRPHTQPIRSASVAGSSQDEYEESESDSDRVMSSSNEEIQSEDNDTTTAVGLGHDVFTPQPNAFSHPPNTQTAPTSYFPTAPTSLSNRLPSNRMITQRTMSQRRERQPDHDAALRASLTTLLSCAAAVRPKDRERTSVVTTSNQPTTLMIVPESVLHSKPAKRRSRESSKERHIKKIRAGKAAHEDVMSPTVMTWMISAGVVLVFSAISFSAGYAWGKEVGRMEEISCGTCSREATRPGIGLRKLRWSAAQSVHA